MAYSIRLDYHNDPFEDQLREMTDKQLSDLLDIAIKKEDYEQAQIIQNEINSRKDEPS